MKLLQQHWTYFKRVRPDLLKLLGMAVATCLVVQVASCWDAPVRLMYLIGQGASVLAVAYITAFIFYYFVNHIQEEKEREVLAQLAFSYLSSMRYGHLGILGEIAGNDMPRGYHPSFDELHAIVSKAKLDTVIVFDSNEAPHDMTLRDLIEQHRYGDLQWTNKILSHGIRIDPEILAHLYIIRDNSSKDLQFTESDLSKNPHTLYDIIEIMYCTDQLVQSLGGYFKRYALRDAHLATTDSPPWDRFRLMIMRAKMHVEVGRKQEERRKNTG